MVRQLANHGARGGARAASAMHLNEILIPDLPQRFGDENRFGLTEIEMQMEGIRGR